MSKVMMIIGDINFAIPELGDTVHTVNKVEKVVFVEREEVGKVGETYLEMGYDAYTVPSMSDYPYTFLERS